jgi:hypothetical protein
MSYALFYGLPKGCRSERLKLLEDCIIDAVDDTMALNILTKLTGMTTSTSKFR